MSSPERPALLPDRLRALVRVVQAALGDVVREAEGDALYETIEDVRRSMVAFRESGSVEGRRRALRAARRKLDRLEPRDRAKLARAYTLYLELANTCENAYRTHRLRARTRSRPRGASSADVIFVLTAHPTESRSPENIRVLRRVQDRLVEAADRAADPDPAALRYLLHLLWRLGTHPRHKPSVEDEASHLFSLLSDPILEELIDLAKSGRRVRVRSWVGGDKDGHPGVGARESLASLQRSRDRLLGFVRERISDGLVEDAALLGGAGLREAAARLRVAAVALRRIRGGDGKRVEDLRRAAARLRKAWRARVAAPHPLLDGLETMLELFPGLVVPLELREERGKFGRKSPVAKMLERLFAVSRGGRLESYVAGVVVSMTTRPEDVVLACKLVEQVTGKQPLPVVPLIELPEALERAVEILDGAWRDPGFRKSARSTDRVEVMLGYSDTAKRMGVLASRVAIGDAMQAIGAWGRKKRLRVLFFHGSGGSVGRGGGTFADRAAGWPRGNLSPFKETLQGEMVERTLASPEILRSNVAKIAAIQARPPRFVPPTDLLRRLAEESRNGFVELVRAPELMTLLARATPYESLGRLTIGSRPAKRAGGDASLERLRAIPWVLCWTQTRYLLHSWLGVGTAWRKLRRDPGAVDRLRRAARADPLLRAYLRTIGFTLAKAAPNVWKGYVETLAPDEAEAFVRRLERERREALQMARSVSPDGDLLHDRRWLLESIRYRAPMIHPLNLMQIALLDRARSGAASREDDELFRETVTGIAAGMLTTG